MSKHKLIFVIRLILVFPYLFQESFAGCSISVNRLTRCHCGEYELNDLDNQIILRTQHQNKNKFKFSTTSNSILGQGGFATIYHAFWKNGTECLALKVINLSNTLSYQRERIRHGAENEVRILQYFRNLPANQNNHIIKMIGYRQLTNRNNDVQFIYIALELSGINLLNYFNQMIEANYNLNNTLINILNCASKALEQFHNHGIHMDIKATNFVIPYNHNFNNQLVSCKLIDFNTSIITNDNQIYQQHFEGTLIYMAPEMHIVNSYVTRKSDIYAFGIMIYKLLYSPNADLLEINIQLIYGYGTIERIMRGCLLENPDSRPSAQAIYLFLNGLCHHFNYEQNEIQENEILCPE